MTEASNGITNVVINSKIILTPLDCDFSEEKIKQIDHSLESFEPMMFSSSVERFTIPNPKVIEYYLTDLIRISIKTIKFHNEEEDLYFSVIADLFMRFKTDISVDEFENVFLDRPISIDLLILVEEIVESTILPIFYGKRIALLSSEYHDWSVEVESGS